MWERTKAQTLKYLKENLPEVKILPLMIITWAEFENNKKAAVCQIQKYFRGSSRLIVRSSCQREDGGSFSNAGSFLSILHVPCHGKAEIQEAIERVYASYKTAEKNEEILIQPMLSELVCSGVVLTRDVYLNTPYYTVNYSESADTAAVTGGNDQKLKTQIIYRGKREFAADDTVKKLLLVCEKIETFLGEDALDIEFAVDSQKEIYIFQVRPIARGKKDFPPYDKLDNALNKLHKKIEKLMRPTPFLLGSTTCFGVMPDWNPAEILGVRPKKLAISLYKELITDNIWAHQRNNYGYRDLTMQPLMASFCGVPYIDTRVTFNSFVPKELHTNLAEKLVNYYMKQLADYPAYHDKIEFQIVFSCYYFGISDQLEVLIDHGFSRNEIKRIEFALLNLTNKVIHPGYGLYKKDIEKAQMLKRQYEQIVESKMSVVDQIYWLIEQCKTYGTLPFAGVARAGFIAVQFLKSFVTKGIISDAEYELFMNSLNTVSQQLRQDREFVKKGVVSKEQFLEKYGHVRPGTYDILSPRYDEAFDEYFQQGVSEEPEVLKKEEAVSFSGDKMKLIQRELEENGLLVSAEELLVFIKESIEGRELVKFLFTKCVSKILQLIEKLGTRNGISKEDMAHLDITVIKQLYVDLYYDNLSQMLKSNIKMNKEQHDCAKLMKLPSMIFQPNDIYCYELLEDEPNFVTLKVITAETVEERDLLTADLKGKAVFIQSADPGYDFLFTKQIGALITQFGGANSHMTIRCAELNIPAVIGAGERNFEKWKRYQRIYLDCSNRKVTKYEGE